MKLKIGTRIKIMEVAGSEQNISHIGKTATIIKVYPDEYIIQLDDNGQNHHYQTEEILRPIDLDIFNELGD